MESFFARRVQPNGNARIGKVRAIRNQKKHAVRVGAEGIAVAQPQKSNP